MSTSPAQRNPLDQKGIKPLYARLREVLSLLLTKTPSLQMIADYEEDRSEDLQEFCINHLRPEIHWSTGIGLIDAARLVVTEAVGNANITSQGEIN